MEYLAEDEEDDRDEEIVEMELGIEMDIDMDPQPGSQEDVEFDAAVLTQRSELSREYGLADKDWIEFLETCASGQKYLVRILDFLRFQEDNDQCGDDLNENLKIYFKHQHSLKNDDGSLKNAPTSMMSWFSMFKKFWRYTKRGRLDDVCPIIVDELKLWVKKHSITKASTFSKEEIFDYHELPDTPDKVLIAAYADVAIATAGRGEETHQKLQNQIKRTQMDGKPCYMVQLNKVKRTGPKVTGWERENVALVTGDVEIAGLDKYLACFTHEERAGSTRLFYKLKRESNGALRATKQVIGKNTAAGFGKVMARALELDDPETYTGHCFKRTGITLCADAGMTVPQLKAYSGHKSDTVVQGYIATSKPQKLLAANALSSGSSQPGFKRNYSDTISHSSSSRSCSSSDQQSRHSAGFNFGSGTINFAGNVTMNINYGAQPPPAVMEIQQHTQCSSASAASHLTAPLSPAAIVNSSAVETTTTTTTQPTPPTEEDSNV